MSTVVTGIFPNVSAASTAVEHLNAAGFSGSEISVLTSEATGDSFSVKTRSKVGEGAAIGAGVGSALAALAAGLTAVGVVGSAGLGVVAAGPLVAALAGAGAGGAVGGIAGALIGLGIPEHEAKFYEGALRKGGILIGVKAEGERRDQVKKIFNECGAETISRA